MIGKIKIILLKWFKIFLWFGINLFEFLILKWCLILFLIKFLNWLKMLKIVIKINMIRKLWGV